ncbi:MAG: tRNA preQ1(34) S-adenosylmethionine ribosyltransferase-isomerase QueA [Planctomycetota bacterium]
MRVDDYDFELPTDLIATRAVEPRDAARLLVYERASARLAHRRFADLVELLAPGDLLVVNDTRVVPWRLRGTRPSGGRVDVLLVERCAGGFRGFARPARKFRLGEAVALEGGAVHVVPRVAHGDGKFDFAVETPAGEDVAAVLERVGRAPLPPYIARDGSEDVAADRARYQTVFAARDGAIAAPTAGMHFTDALLDRLAQGGVQRATVTLHVGLGTFAPVRVEDVEKHVMHREHYEVSAATAAAVVATRERGGRIVAVGTTSARALETCAEPGRVVRAGVGETDLFLYPGRALHVVDALITNFHLPRSTLLMLVAAMVGRERLLALYAEAIAQRYRFYSFGDAMLVL